MRRFLGVRVLVRERKTGIEVMGLTMAKSATKVVTSELTCMGRVWHRDNPRALFHGITNSPLI